MLKKYPMVLMLSLLSVVYTGLAAAASPKQKEEAPYVANFSYTPASQAAPGSAGVTLVIGNVGLLSNSKTPWFPSPQFDNLDKAIKEDLTKLFTAKGFTIRGPFDSYDLIPYPDKKTIDLYLVPIFDLSTTTPDKISSEDTQVEVTGKIILELREIVTRELMWSKSVPFTKFEVPFTFRVITYQRGIDPNKIGTTIIMKYVESLEFGSGTMNSLAKEIEKQYPDLMATISKLIDPEEMRIIKKQCQELKSKKGY